MIHFISLLCSLCIQFAAVDYPVDLRELNSLNLDLATRAVNSLNQSYNYNVDVSRVIIVNRNNATYPYYLFFPKELVDNSVSSSIYCNTRNDSYVGAVSTQWLRVQLTTTGTVFTGSSPTVSSIGNIYLSGNNNAVLYNYYYELPYQSIPSFIVGLPNNDPVSTGHSSGWSNLIQEDENGVFYTVLGHSNGTLDNSNTIDLVDSSSSLTDKLLTVLINLTSGMNDNISYGLGSLISLFNQGLNVVGLDGIATKLDNLFNKVEDGVDTTNDYIAWVSEPFDAGEFDIAVQNSGFGNFSALAHTIQTTLDAARTDNTHVYITLDLSNVRYFSGFGSRTYDLATYLNGSKSIWQPLLLTFIYASVFWGFFRSIPNIVGGASPIVNSVSGGGKNA